MPEHIDRIAALIRNGEKLEAIKLLRESTGVDLRTAKEEVERLSAEFSSGHSGAAPSTADVVSDAPRIVPPEVEALARSGRKVAAIKLLREQTGLGLKEAKERVEAATPDLKSGCVTVSVFLFLIPVLAVLSAAVCFGQDLAAPYSADECSSCAEWSEPQEPFRLFGNSWYVGTRGLSSILVTSDEGHVLIDGGLPNNAPMILANIRKVGFDPRDVKLILNTHAHFDHAGGLAALQAETGASVMAGAVSVVVLESGRSGPDDPQYGELLAFPPVANVGRFSFGQVLRVGSLTLRPHATGGHAPGGTTWSWTSCEGDRCLAIVYADSQTPVSADGFRFSDTRTYPTVLDEFARGHDTLERLACDILVTTHPSASSMWERMASGPSGLVDPEACRRYAATARRQLDVRLEAERKTLADDLVYAVGADLSFLRAAEERGVEFRDGGVAKPGLDIFRDHGYDWIRLRLFHTPDRLPNSLEYTIAAAKDAKTRGFRFLLDYHFADSWADPGKQPTPAAWDTTHIDVLSDSVFAYVRRTIGAFREAGVMPEMVQIGNEVRNGMMWPLGRLPDNWDNFARLFKAGLDGIEAGRGEGPRPLIMLHYDNGADEHGARAFYERFATYDIPYDVIGLSYYPWWHGNLIDLRDNVLSLLDHFPDKDLMLVEVGYRPREYGTDKPPPYPEDTPGGPRKAFLEAVNQTLLAIPSRRIKGIFWWEPASGCGRDFFDADCEALPVMTVFDRFKRQ